MTAAATVIHGLVARCRAGEYPGLVTRLSSGWVILGERQVLAGYSLLLPDPVVAHLNVLKPDARGNFLADMGRVGDALLSVTAAVRINYAIFGNVEPALHAHIFPRRSTEPDASRTAQPWALDWGSAAPFSEQLHGELRRALAARLVSLA